MTECELCKGTGKLLKPWYDTTGAMTGMTGDICFMCDGKGTIGEPQTNEEYIKSLNTEQLAKWLSNHVKFVYDCGLREVLPKTMYEEDWEWWLKQPHTNEVGK